MTGLASRMLDWLRQRFEAAKPATTGRAYLRKSSERRERQPDVDQVEELVRIVGEADASEPRPRTRPTSARRIRSRPR